MKNERTKSKVEELIDDNGDRYTERALKAVVVGSVALGTIFGVAHLAGENGPTKTSTTTVEYTAKSGDTASGVIDGYCPAATPEERQAMIDQAAIANSAVSPDSFHLDVGDTYKLPLNTEVCEPVKGSQNSN